MSITNLGNSLEQAIVSIINQSSSKYTARLNKGSGKQKSKGDIIITDTITKEEFFIESKKNSWNQIRPYKYIVHVGYDENDDVYCVISPNDLIKYAYGKNSGQHQKNPFVCLGAGKQPYKHFNVVSESCLEKEIIQAYYRGKNNTGLEKASSILREREEQRVKEDKLLIKSFLD